jgi:hypothetical protein
MVSLLKDFPPYVVAYTAKGKVNEQEYRELVMRRVDEAGRHYRRFNFIVCLQTSFRNYRLGTFIQYLVISFKYYSRWNRMAIVSDEKWVRQLYRVLNFLVPGEIRSYPLNDFSRAKRWVSEPIASGR